MHDELGDRGEIVSVPTLFSQRKEAEPRAPPPLIRELVSSDRLLRLYLRAVEHRQVHLTPALAELGALRGHPRLRRLELGGVVAYVLRDLHRAELGAAHAAEVGDLGALCRERLVVVGQRRHRVEREVELVAPAELEARLTQRVVPLL